VNQESLCEPEVPKRDFCKGASTGTKPIRDWSGRHEHRTREREVNIAKAAMQMDGSLGNLPCPGRPKLLSMAALESGEPKWLWENRIPFGGITLLEGDPGHGKSTLTDDLVARLTSGRAMPLSKDEEAHAAGAVLLRGEESLRAVVRPRLEAAGANLRKVLAVDRVESFRLPDDLEVLRQGVLEVGARLVVIDPLPQFVGANLNSSSGTQKALSPLASLADELNIAVVLVRHLGKSASRNAIYRGLGSVSIIGLARSALLVAADPASDDKHQHMLVLSKSNLGSAKSVSYRTEKRGDGAITIKWLGHVSQSAEAVAAGYDTVLECSELERAMDFLYGVLVDGEKPQREVLSMAKQADLAKRTLYRAKRVMKIKSKRVGRTYWVWRLPSGDVEAVHAVKERFVAELCDWLVDESAA
jgi:hypothetical protein